MPESMIERVARELWQCAYDDAGPVNQCYGATADEGWASYADDARRVIAAMHRSIQALSGKVDDDPSIVRLTSLYHNLLREWAEL